MCFETEPPLRTNRPAYDISVGNAHKMPILLHPFVVCAAIGADRAENTIPLLLFTGRCLVTAVI
jgi:hypothetical protein